MLILKNRVMKKISFIIGSIILIVGLTAISWNKTPLIESSLNKPVAVENFKDHWNDGKAEISSYTLQQSRYGLSIFI